MLLNNKSKMISYGGIITALGIILIYLSTIMPFNKLFMLTIASLLIPIGVIYTGTKNSILIYIATSILSLIFFGIREVTILYILFFGNYGIIKFYIEKLRNIPLELVLKFLYFNCMAFLALLIFKNMSTNPVDLKYPLYYFILGGEIAFLVYDYLITIVIDCFQKKSHIHK